jgi:hypothetical protein
MLPHDPLPGARALSSEELTAIRNNGEVSWRGVQIAVEGDLVRVRSAETSDQDQLVYILLVCEEVIRIHGHFYMLSIMRDRASAMPPEQRRLAAEWSRKHPSRGTAIVNRGNWVANTMVTLLIRGINVLISRPIPLAFFGSEAEALAWLQSLRQKQPATP